MTDMEGIERRSESPSTRTSSRLSKLSDQESFGDQEPEMKMKGKSPSIKRKSRSGDKDNDEIKNGEVNGSDDQHQNHNGDEVEMTEVNVVRENEQNGNENGGESDSVSDVEEQIENSRGESNGDVLEDGESTANGDAQDIVETSPKSEENQKESGNESLNVDTEESYVTAECAQLDRTESGELNTTEDNENVESESDREKENGCEIDVNVTIVDEEKTTEKKGFFGKWSFGLSSEKKETNGHAEEFNTSNLYFSSIRGRMPLNRASPDTTITGLNSIIRSELKTPITTRNLNDSFTVKSEPSRTRADSRDRPNLRKYPAKRCLNADETEDRDNSFLSNLGYAKRRKLNEEKNRTGFLRSFLWSPFKKRSEDEVATNQVEESGTVAKTSWFKSPFWFWRRCSREEERN